MKGVSLFVAALLMCAVCSCSREMLSPVTEPDGHIGSATIIATTAQWPESRTTLGDNLEVLWSEGDSFALVSGDGKLSKFTISSGAGTTKGTFTGEVEGTAPYYAVYPYSDNVSISGGNILFSLPQEQRVAAGNILPGASPAVAMLESEDAPISFSNTGSVLCIPVSGSGKLASLALHELNGAPLWGDVNVSVDSERFGTSSSVTGGSNTLRLVFDKPITYNRGETRIYIAVPCGVFSRGFSATLYDADGEAYSFLQTQADNTVSRSGLLLMPKVKIMENRETKDVARRGYYKDLFMDSGINLTSRLQLYAAPHIGFSYELFSSSTAKEGEVTAEDTEMQRKVMRGSEEDENGNLLYPDGSPRFRCIYMNGGGAEGHGKSLEEEGLERIRTFNRNGGAYVGTCAGAFLGSTTYGTYASNPNYLHLWPGKTNSTKVVVNGTRQSMLKARHRMQIEPGSPLLKYYPFSDIIGNVYHNGGCYMEANDVVVAGVAIPFPKGTEVLMRYYLAGSTASNDSTEVHLKPSIWAYRKDASTGRVVLCGSHPEMASSGEQLDLMGAMLLYATDGCGEPRIKGELKNGTPWSMTKKWSDGDLLHAGIGDRQYHHFTMEVPSGAGQVTVSLSGNEGDNLYLAIRRDGYAWISDAEYVLCSEGADKTLTIDNLAPGTWYVSVFCPDNIVASKYTEGNVSYYNYLGKKNSLNGIPYTLKCRFDFNR